MEQIVAKQGKSKILAFRILDEAGTETARRLALQTEHTLRYERGNDVTQTKDGPVNNPGGLTTTLDISAIASNDPLNNMLRDSVVNGQKLEIWEIDLSDVRTPADTYGALYMQGNLRSWDVPAPTEGPIELSTSADIDGKPQAGVVTMTAAEVEQVQYAFRGLGPVTP